MTATPNSKFDQAELLHLALDAGRNGDSGATLAFLKEAVSRPDATGKAHFLLGSEYAQLRMYDRAVLEMEAAVAVDPTLYIARFQLGLLWLSSGDGARALAVLEPLELLDSGNPLASFAKGLMHLIRDEFTETLECLALGIQLNTENPALNGDMQKIIEQVNALPPEVLNKKESAETASDTPHIFMSAYTGKGNN